MKNLKFIAVLAMTFSITSVMADLPDEARDNCVMNPSQCIEIANPTISISGISYKLAWEDKYSENYTVLGILHTLCVTKGYKRGYASVQTSLKPENMVTFTGVYNTESGALSSEYGPHSYVSKVVCSK